MDDEVTLEQLRERLTEEDWVEMRAILVRQDKLRELEQERRQSLRLVALVLGVVLLVASAALWAVA